jgi:hypothetical protein
METKQLRIITAKADIAEIVDEGAKTKSEIETLTEKDKKFKAKIASYVEDEMDEGEISVRLAGNKSIAVVTAMESYEIRASSPSYAGAQIAISAGLLADIVKCDRNLAVPLAEIDKAAEILKKAGISALVSETYSVNPEAYRDMSDNIGVSPNVLQARAALRECTSKNVTFRVKYEKDK